jgi:hypothetical protein
MAEEEEPGISTERSASLAITIVPLTNKTEKRG